MAPAVTTQLADVLGQVTGWDDLEDTRFLRGFQARGETALWLTPFPTAGGIVDSRRQLGRCER